MFKFLNVFTQNKPTTTTNCILHEKFNDTPFDIYNNFDNPLFSIKQLENIIGKMKGSSCEYITHDELIDFLFKCKHSEAANFLKWVGNVLKRFTHHSKRTVYDEIEKTGHVYVLQTDGGIKVGKTKDDVKKRIKNLQTGNVSDIKILYDYHTCNMDLLEKYVHFILQRYRCNSNREFFECNVDYIIKIINISGNILDTLKSSFETISEDEIYERISNKLHTNKLKRKCQEESHSTGECDSLSESSSSHASHASHASHQGQGPLNVFLKKHIVYEYDSKLSLRDLNFKYYKRRISPRTETRNLSIIDEFIKDTFGESCKVGDGYWKHLKLVD